MLLCAPTPGMPFGGIKDSGYGRECSDFGIYELSTSRACSSRTDNAHIFDAILLLLHFDLNRAGDAIGFNQLLFLKAVRYLSGA